MSRNKSNNMNILQHEIRRQFNSAGTSRFLRALPGFEVEAAIPMRLVDLLKELDRAEADRTNTRHPPHNEPKDGHKSAEGSDRRGGRPSSRHH
jgi:hypothetical protein